MKPVYAVWALPRVFLIQIMLFLKGMHDETFHLLLDVIHLLFHDDG